MMKTIFTVLTLTIATSSTLAATNPALEQYFSQNVSPAKVGLQETMNGVTTSLKLLNCSSLDLAAEDSEETYGVCTFEAQGYMLKSVYSVIVNPSGYGFATAVEVGNFLD